MENWNYEKAGVNVHAGYEAVRRIAPHAKKTHIPGVLAGLGGFGGLFEMPAGYTHPVLVSGTDSVGTKLMVAYETGKHDTVGIDCVAMCVNDIICQGAKPLFFLDYIGISRLDPVLVESVVAGVSEGCLQAGCALIGGETAELPDLYKPGEYDLAGFAVGVVEKDKLITGERVTEGDVLIGVASSGLHSNGFSLVRRLTFEKQGYTAGTFVPELGTTLGETLLTPTKIYARLMDTLTQRFNIHGAANITGGGWIENIPRLLGSNDTFQIVAHTDAAPIPPIFTLLQAWGSISKRDMYNTFNMGVGFTLAVAREDADAVLTAISETGETAYAIGYVGGSHSGEEQIVLV